MRTISGFVAAVFMIYSGSAFAAPLIQGSYVLEQIRLGSETYDAREFLTKQFRQQLPDVIAVQIAFIFDGDDVTSHAELLSRHDVLGYFTCTSQVTLEVEWQDSLFIVPVTAKSQQRLRNITDSGGLWDDKGDVGCGATLKKGSYRVALDGDKLTMIGGDGAETVLRRDTGPFMSYRELLPPPK